MLALGLCVATGAPAEAIRPLVRPAPALKNVRLAIPFTYEELSKKEITGLDLEDNATRKAALQQARDYIDYRRGRLPAVRAIAWRAECERNLGTLKETALCRYEIDRASSTRSRKTPVARTERDRLADALRNSKFEQATGADFSTVIRAVSSLGDAQASVPVAQRLVSMDTCVPSTVSSALGYKIEELFPAPESVDLTKKLYRHASRCGKDSASAQAAFRLGLILIWQHQCIEIKDLMAQTESISDGSQFHARAKYWRHYCAQKLGDEEGKIDAKNALIKDHPFSFQNLSVNGGEEVTVKSFLKSEDPFVSVRSLVRPDLNGLIRATEALVKEGSNEIASEVLDRSVRDLEGLEPEVRMYSAVLLHRIGFALPKFKILTGLFQDSPKMISTSTLKMYFPLWYFDVVRAKQDRIDPLLIISLIRQESAFNKDARSIVGARGLMQVMPATARMVASVRARSLSDPDTNIGVGTKYFQKRLEQYSGDVELTLAAYNAGAGRVDQWVRRYPTDNKMLFLDFIPFRETRDYVSSILRNYYFYVRLYGNAPVEAAALAEGVKVAAPVPKHEAKVQAILSANAGSVAMAK